MSLRQSDLERQARKFAGDLSELLNGTVTHGVRLRSYMDRRGRAVVGYKVSESNPVGDCVPLTISRSPARLHLSVLHTLELDDSETFLTTNKSSYTLQADDDTASILTYDFVREPPNEFPEAHIHIHGESEILVRMLRSSGRDKSKPADLHLPVGGAASADASKTSSSSAYSAEASEEPSQARTRRERHFHYECVEPLSRAANTVPEAAACG